MGAPAGRRPVSGLAGLGRPPSHSRGASSGVEGDPHRLTVAGAAPEWPWSITPRRTGFPFHPRREMRSADTCAKHYSGTDGTLTPVLGNCYNPRPFKDLPRALPDS